MAKYFSKINDLILIKFVWLKAKHELANGADQNNFLDYCLAIDGFPLTKQEVEQLMDINQFIGLAKQQTQGYIHSVLEQLKEKQHD